MKNPDPPFERAAVEGGRILAERSGDRFDLIECAKIRLFGPHNLENVLAAFLAALEALEALEWAVAAETIGEAVATFSPLPHRTTLIEEINGVRYVDDSKGTNPHATLSGSDRKYVDPHGASAPFTQRGRPGGLSPSQPALFGPAAGASNLLTREFVGTVPGLCALSRPRSGKLNTGFDPAPLVDHFA